MGGNLIAEADGAGNLTRSYYYMAGMRLAAADRDGNLYYFHNNHLETPVQMTGEGGNVVWAADYLPFGKANVTIEEIRNDFRFPGQTYDAETGYHYNWNRYYSPETGRYLTADPIGQAGGVNVYAYVLNDPLNYIDPKGLYGNKVIKLSKKLWGKVMPARGPLQKGGVYKDPRVKVYGDEKATQYLKTKIYTDGRVESKINLKVPKKGVQIAVNALKKSSMVLIPFIFELIDPFDADALGNGELPDYLRPEKQSPCN